MEQTQQSSHNEAWICDFEANYWWGKFPFRFRDMDCFECQVMEEGDWSAKYFTVRNGIKIPGKARNQMLLIARDYNRSALEYFVKSLPDKIEVLRHECAKNKYGIVIGSGRTVGRFVYEGVSLCGEVKNYGCSMWETHALLSFVGKSPMGLGNPFYPVEK